MINKFRIAFLFFVLMYVATTLNAQKLHLIVNTVPVNKFSYKNECKDSLTAIKQINDLLKNFTTDGFQLASLDSITRKNDTLKAYIVLGEKYNFYVLNIDEMIKSDLKKAGLNHININKNGFSEFRLIRFQSKLIDFYQNNGYPFAQIKFDSIRINNDSVFANLVVKKYKQILFDSLVLNGDTKIKNSYLKSYLGIVKYQPFSQKKVDEIPKYIRQLPFLKLKSKPELYFEKDKSHIFLSVDERKAGQFDFILGVLPNENNGKLLITGEASLRLRNLFNTAKSLNVDWKRFQQASQVFDVDYTHTRLLNSALDVGLMFKFLKQDTLFSQINRGISIGTLLSARFRLGFFAEIHNTRLDPRTAASDNYKNAIKLPEYSDLNINKYGIELNWNNTDDIFYPKKGLNIQLKTSIGNRAIVINEILNPNLYLDIPLKNLQFDYKTTFTNYFKISTNSTFMFRNTTAQVYNDNLFQNDLMRIGGLQSLRGFNEQFFFTSFYNISTFEYRFFTDETSYLFVFYDQSYINRDVLNTYQEDFPLGVGAGISFTTSSGIFNFAYSVGKSNVQPFSLNYSKLHFGFVSKF